MRMNKPIIIHLFTFIFIMNCMYTELGVSAATGTLITNMVCADSLLGGSWSIQTDFNVGLQLFGDRPSGKGVVTCPDYLKGSEWIKPAYDSRKFTGDPLVTFTLPQPATIYIAFPCNITTKPSWLSTFKPTGDRMDTQEGTWGQCDIYKKYFTNGQVSFGNNGDSSRNMYIVIASRQLPLIVDMNVTPHEYSGVNLDTKWSIQYNLKVTDKVYADRNDRTFKIIPNDTIGKYVGNDWISPSIDSGQGYSGNNLVSFKVTKNTMVYVAHIDKIADGQKPSWLGEWTKNGDKITVTDPTMGLLNYSVFERYYPKDTLVMLGGNNTTTSLHYNYFVIASDKYLPLIANLDVRDTDINSSTKWSLAKNFALNDMQYGDCDKSFSSIPLELTGCDWIKTAFGSAQYKDDPLVQFFVTQDMTVYLGHSNDIEEKPDWMKKWVMTDMQFTNSDGIIFSIYAKYYPANSKVELGSNGSTVESMYTVFIKPTDKSNADIKTIKIGNEDLTGVKPGTSQYIMSLPYGTTTESMPMITAYSTEPASQVSIVMPEKLPGKATITVVSIDNCNKVYEVNFSVKPPLEFSDMSFSDSRVTAMSIDASITVVNNYNDEVAVTLMVGLCSGSKEDYVLERINFISDTVISNQPKNLMVKMEVQDDGKQYFIKAYLMGDLVEMQPYSRVFELQ